MLTGRASENRYVKKLKNKESCVLRNVLKQMWYSVQRCSINNKHGGSGRKKAGGSLKSIESTGSPHSPGQPIYLHFSIPRPRHLFPLPMFMTRGNTVKHAPPVHPFPPTLNSCSCSHNGFGESNVGRQHTLGPLCDA